MSRNGRYTVRASGVAMTLVAATAFVAAVVHLAFAGSARQLLDFPFAGLEPVPGTAAAILATNLRLLIGVIAATVIVQSPWCAKRHEARSGIGLIVVAALDTLIALEVFLNALVVGASLGAYGWRMVLAVLPHGPLELAAFASALALYVRSRSERMPAPLIARVAFVGFGALLLAAVLETYVAL
ncbi:hypothetical protein C8N24_0641 [Solirubrobacter pauli]|uniref:Stage II sporulation protein M n=1 Tax=Solirubrobacter pauli TaxID=166793 RepID=A0A660L8W6_9ACTN|nr:hypothetical protein [Solirubrobacter pauli]RKQ90826.1 hypothetical protein C8N24_0641 [Solirubrobacter pauli]